MSVWWRHIGSIEWISNDNEWPLTQVSRLRYLLKANVSKRCICPTADNSVYCDWQQVVDSTVNDYVNRWVLLLNFSALMLQFLERLSSHIGAVPCEITLANTLWYNRLGLYAVLRMSVSRCDGVARKRSAFVKLCSCRGWSTVTTSSYKTTVNFTVPPRWVGTAGLRLSKIPLKLGIGTKATKLWQGK